MPHSNLFSELERFANNTALIDENNCALNYAELAAQADELCAPLYKNRGLVALEAANELPSILMLIGACRAGCPILLIGPNDLETKTNLRDDYSPDYEFIKKGASWVLNSRQVINDHDLHPELALMLSTSGSTGSSKQVRLSHENLQSNAESIVEYLSIQADDRAITVLPYNYSFGLSIITSHLACGASIALTEKSVLDDGFWEEFQKKEATSFSGVPRTYEILARNDFLEKQIPNLKTFTQAGGRLQPELVKKLSHYAIQRNAKFFVMYGQTEASPRISYLPPNLASENPDCIGIPVPGGKLSLLDEHGQPITTTDKAGELEFTGPNVMMGYALSRKDLHKNKDVHELRTGDIAVRKENGLYKIVGRASRFVKIVGLRLSLDDIESNLKSDGISCMVSGDDECIIIGSDDTSISNRRIEKKLLSLYKIPSNTLKVILLKTLPTLPTGKPDYRSLLQKHKPKPSNKPATLKVRFENLLGRNDLGDSETFLTAGGDSLSYVEASIAVEHAYGRLVPNWEKVPFKELFSLNLKHDNVATNSQFDSILVARAIAIALAMTSHAFIKFGVWEHLSEHLRLITRVATPCFLVLYGLGLARSYSGKEKSKDLKSLVKRLIPKAATIYAAFAAIVISSLCWGTYSVGQVIQTLSFNHSGGYGDILMMYFVLYLVAPFVIYSIEKFKAVGYIALLLIPWMLWPTLNTVDSSSFFLSYLFGIGNIVGPSVLFSLTFLLVGYAWGAYKLNYLYKTCSFIIVTISIIILSYGLVEIGTKEFTNGIASMAYRVENHPFYFSYGVLGSIIIILIAKGFSLTIPNNKNTAIILGLGANSIFAYTFGNVLLSILPSGNFLPDFARAILAGLFLIGLTVYTYDINQTSPRFFGPFTKYGQYANKGLFNIGTLAGKLFKK